MKIGKPDNIHK